MSDGPVVSVRDEDFEPASVKFIHRDGYGFLVRDSGSDVFFHTSRLAPEIVNCLGEGTQVMVAVGDGKKGPSALAMKLA